MATCRPAAQPTPPAPAPSCLLPPFAPSRRYSPSGRALALPPAGLLGWESLGTQGLSQYLLQQLAPLGIGTCPGELLPPRRFTWDSQGALASDHRPEG